MDEIQLEARSTALPHPPEPAFGDLLAVPDDATPVVQHALAAFGSVAKAMRWLHKPSRPLGGAVPIVLLIQGKREPVENELSRIEHGGYL